MSTKPMLLQLTQPVIGSNEPIWVGATHIVTMKSIGEGTQIELSVPPRAEAKQDFY